MSKIIEAAKEAVAIAKGEVAAPRITINGHSYVPEMVAAYANDCVDAAKTEIDRLRRDCAELYQVIGTMAEHCPDPCAPQIVKALDNASNAANGYTKRHDDLLPFILPESQITKLRTLASDLNALLGELPVKHPQQSERKDELRARVESLLGKDKG